MSLGEALARHAPKQKSGHLLFAREKTGGARQYVSMRPEQAWKETSLSKQTHLYEVLSHHCKLYLDIEWVCPKNPGQLEKTKVDAIGQATVDIVRKVYGVDSTYVAVTASGKVAYGFKCSWHLHFDTPGLSWLNATAVGDFVQEHLSQFDEVDKVPYRHPTQNWRCVGSSKVCDPARVLLPCSQSTFFKCIVQQRPGKHDHIIPPKQHPSAPVVCAVPPNALRVARLFPDARVSSVYMTNGSLRYMVVPFMSKKCPIAGRKHSSNHQYGVVDLQAMRWRHCCHNAACSASTPPWMPMPKFDTCKAMLVTSLPTGVPVLCNSAPDRTVRFRGPPPVSMFTAHVKCIECVNGCYRLP